MHSYCYIRVIRHYSDEVSPFRDLRIKGCLAPPRSLSQLYYVFHRHKEPRHPPYALNFLLGNLSITDFFEKTALFSKSLSRLSLHSHEKTPSSFLKKEWTQRPHYCFDNELICSESLYTIPMMESSSRPLHYRNNVSPLYVHIYELLNKKTACWRRVCYTTKTG